jgi:hypothetical protein
MACVEEVNRIRRFKPRIEDAQKRAYSLDRLEQQPKPVRQRAVAETNPNQAESQTFAYIFA